MDLIYFKEWGKDYEKYFRKKIDFETLKRYASKYPKRIKERILKIGKNSKLTLR